MQINKLKNFLLIIIISFIIISCSSVKNAFDPERKNTSEEFLVEKKTPLSIPPDFEKLPIPQSEQNQKNKPDKIETLLKTTDLGEIKSSENEDVKLDKLILDKIKNN